MPPPVPRRRRARPVADAPIDGLLPCGRDLAKGWLLALVEDAPLEKVTRLLGTRLADEGPELCVAVLRALVDDLELRRLEPDGPLGELAARAGELAGVAGDPVEVARAVDALGDVLWSALRAELREADAELAADLAERLALVIARVRAAALVRSPAVAATAPAVPAAAPAVPAAAPAGAAGRPVASAAREAPAAGQPAAPSPGEAPAAGQPAAPGPGEAPPARRPAAGTGAHPASSSAGELWVSALDDEIAGAAGSPLALLLAELEDAERLSATEGPAGATAAFEHFAQALRTVVRRQDILVSESGSRAWIIARETGRPDAHALGSRVAEAVGAGAWRGAPLIASIGLAVLGEDGLTSGELIEAAEEARFAASASGTDISR